jgi:hypothetical protein
MIGRSRNDGGRKMAWDEDEPRFRASAAAGWEAALLEFEHQAEHWDTPDHRETGHLIASALRAAVDIARSGGLGCEHRQNTEPAAGEAPRTAASSDPAQHPPGARRNRDAA